MSKIRLRCFIGILLSLVLLLSACNDHPEMPDDSTDSPSQSESQSTADTLPGESGSSHKTEGLSALIPGVPVTPSEATAAPSATGADKARLSTFLSNTFGKSYPDIPIAFRYNGVLYQGFGGASCQRDGNTVRAAFGSALEVVLTVTERPDYGVVTWQLTFRNLTNQTVSLSDITLLQAFADTARDPLFTYYAHKADSAEAYTLPFRPGMSIHFKSKDAKTLGYFTLSHENGSYLFVPKGADWQLSLGSAYGGTNTTGGPTVKLSVSASLTESYDLAPNEELTTASLTLITTGAERESLLGDLFTAWNKSFGGDSYTDSPWQ